MAEVKTTKNDADVGEFLKQAAPERQEDLQAILEMMREITGDEPAMWGPSIIGFGSYHYRYESGREGDCFITGFSPRKRNITIYIMSGFSRWQEILSRLGEHKIGKSCLYIKRLSNINVGVLKELIRDSVQHMREKYGAPAEMR